MTHSSFALKDIVTIDNQLAIVATSSDFATDTVLTPWSIQAIESYDSPFKPADKASLGKFDDVQFVGSLRKLPEFNNVIFNDQGNQIALVQLSSVDTDASLDVMATVAVKSDSTANPKWLTIRPLPWEDAFDLFIRMTASKMMNGGKDMIRDKGPVERDVIRDHEQHNEQPDPMDPVNIQAKVVQEMLSNLFAGGDFGATLNIEGRTLPNGEAEISGSFSLLFKGKK